ncbi:immunity protein Imm33 domain-containing protein [Brevibacillus daliensis]|uniref:immunity protein Imm33 domain-containing protein n=1 Tax=Brevibacillus daliensis TaxID=2892995 RepID=UPI001E48B4C9|nr:hypothetical protein [Brevibacillus daliensis]
MIQQSKQIRNRLFKVSCKEYLSKQAESLLDLVEEIDKEEGPIKDGANIQFGWIILTVCERESDWVIVAPDFTNNPFIDKTEDITISLNVLVGQTYNLNKMQVEGEATLFHDKIVVAKGVFDMEHVYLERSQKSGDGDSGWYVGPVEKPDGEIELESYYVYQLLALRPSLLQALALPTGYMVVFDGKEIEVVLDPYDVNVWSFEK